jgi:polyisoprenoid-binding protein YceI
MVTWVRGLFKDIRGTIEWDRSHCEDTTFAGHIDATRIWTGENERDAHLRSPDFFDVENHPDITVTGRFTERVGDLQFKALADLTMRGNTRQVPLDVAYLGEWKTPFWAEGENRGEMRRIGFEATGRLDRHAFGVSWQDELPGGGVVASNEVELTLDVEALALEDLERTGAVEYYREIDALPSQGEGSRDAVRPEARGALPGDRWGGGPRLAGHHHPAAHHHGTPVGRGPHHTADLPALRRRLPGGGLQRRLG